MKAGLVSMCHCIIWLSFSLVLFLSERDKTPAKIALFLLFLYFAYTFAHSVLQRRKHAAILTIRNSSLFILIYQAILWLYRL